MSTNRTAFPWRRIAAYLTFLVAALVALYALAGYVLLPLPDPAHGTCTAAERLQRDLQLHHVDFNPFTWRMTLQGLTLRGAVGDTPRERRRSDHRSRCGSAVGPRDMARRYDRSAHGCISALRPMANLIWHG